MAKRKKHRKLHMGYNLKRLITLAALLVVGLFFPLFAAANDGLIEKVFANGLYIPISSVLGFISSLVPMSLTELVIFALCIAVIVLVVMWVIRLFKRRTSLSGFFNGLLSLAIVAAALLNAFYFTGGLNYHRMPLDALMDLNINERDEQAVYALCMDLVSDANSLRSGLEEDSDGVMMLSCDDKECFERVRSAFTVLGETEEIFSRKLYRAKAVYSSDIMSSAGISGLYMPLLGEVNINVDQPDIAIPFATAHESAHYQGFMREDEANFIAYLACMASDDPAMRYSGTVMTLTYCLPALTDADGIVAAMSEAVKRDLTAFSDYWAAHDGDLYTLISDLNDGYLKYNDQPAGADSYGDVVDLLLAYRDKRAVVSY